MGACSSKRIDTSKDTDGDDLSDSQAYSLEEALRLAASIGATLAPDQAALFAKNAWSRYEGTVLQCHNLEVIERNWFNSLIEIMSNLLDPDGGPRFHIGRYDYREEVVGLTYRYRVVGFVDEQTRLVIHPFIDEEPEDRIIVTKIPADMVRGGGKPAVGEEMAWKVTGYKGLCSAGMLNRFGEFTVSCRVTDASAL